MTLAREPWTREPAEPWLVLVTAVVMVVDALLLIAHIIHHSASLLDWDATQFPLFRSGALWSGAQDGSLLELFGLLQLGAAAVVFLLLGLREPAHRVLAGWGAVFLLLVADDLLQIHERVGARLSLDQAVPSLGGNAAQEVGGLLFWVASGLVLVGGLIRLHLASVPAARRESWGVVATVLPFVAAAVAFVLFSAVAPGLLYNPWGEVVALGRMTVKLLTMTLLLVQALRIGAAGP